MEDDKIFKIYLVEPITIPNITQEKLDEDFTEELYQNITPEEITQNKVAVIGEDVFYIRCDDNKIKKLSFKKTFAGVHSRCHCLFVGG